MTIKECLSKLHNGNDVREALSEYLGQSMHLYGDYARVKLMMEYFLYYETLAECMKQCTDAVKEDTDEINKIISEFLDTKSSDDIRRHKKALAGMRDVIIEKMEVLTAYVDRFIVYEYVLNRLQYRFDDMAAIPEDIPFTRDVLQFIFGSGDNAAINDNIRFVVGQLPVRMARSHYFDLIRQCLSIYKGNEKEALDNFLYMFRTSATLYHTDNMGKYFTEFVPVLEEFASVGYENITKDVYEIYLEKLNINTSKIRELCDLYMQLGSIVNDMYVMADAAMFGIDGTDIEVSNEVLRGINDLFMERESDVWPVSMQGASEEDKLLWLSGRLTEAEGYQEKLFVRISRAEAALEETVSVYKADIAALGIQEGFISLANASKISSNSIFVKLFDEDESLDVIAGSGINESGDEGRDILTESELEKITAALISELKEKLSGSSKMVRRAIMASTLEKLPVFFQNRQEVADYISSSFAQCDDMAEKYAAKQLIMDVMQDQG